MVDVAAPLGDNGRWPRHVAQTPHGNHRVVAILGPPAHVHDDHIVYLHCRVAFRQIPHLEQTVGQRHEVDTLLGRLSALAYALDVTCEHRQLDASLLQAVEVFAVKRVVAGCGKGLARRSRVLGHHQLMGAVLPALGVIPVDLFQCASGTPQFSFIVIHPLPQGRRIVNIQPIDTYFMPWHEHWFLVAAVLASPEPLVVKVVAHAVCSGLENNDRLGFESNAAAHASHQVIGTVHRTLLPESHLAQVRHRYVITSHGVLAARTTREHQTITADDLLHVGLSLELGEPQLFFAFVKQFHGIVPQQQVIHPLDALARSMQMTANEAVPPLVPDKLHPCQIHLNQRRATPLASLEQYDAHRTSRRALCLHCRQQAPLWPVEHQRHVASAHLVLDGHTASTPIFKILGDAPPLLFQ